MFIGKLLQIVLEIAMYSMAGPGLLCLSMTSSFGLPGQWNQKLLSYKMHEHTALQNQEQGVQLT